MKTKLTAIKALAGVAMLSGAIGMTGIVSAATPVSVSSPSTNTVSASSQQTRQHRRMPGIRGRVSAINNNIITIASVSRKQTVTTEYNIDAKDAIIMKTDGKSRPVTAVIGDIKVGDKLAVRGVFDGTNVKATKVLDGAYRYGNHPRMNRHVGMVTAINGDILNVSNMKSTASASYIVDASNAKIIKNGALSNISAISVGDKIRIRGKIDGTNITAKVIRDGKGMIHPIDTTSTK